MKVGDVVLMIPELPIPRNAWTIIGRVSKIFPSADEIVRKVEVVRKDRKFYERHVNKLILLVAGDEQKYDILF